MLNTDNQQNSLNEILTLCQNNNWLISTAESCTGGLLSAVLTSQAGSSTLFDRAFITYTNEAKWELLGVNLDIFDNEGAVSEKCVEFMCRGALDASRSNLAVAISGVAGPGASERKPVGLVFIGLMWRDTRHDDMGEAEIHQCQFTGSRDDIRENTVQKAIELILKKLKEKAAILGNF